MVRRWIATNNLYNHPPPTNCFMEKKVKRKCPVCNKIVSNMAHLKQHITQKAIVDEKHKTHLEGYGIGAGDWQRLGDILKHEAGRIE